MRAYKNYNDLYTRISEYHGVMDKYELHLIICALVESIEEERDEEDTIGEINEYLNLGESVER